MMHSSSCGSLEAAGPRRFGGTIDARAATSKGTTSTSQSLPLLGCRVQPLPGREAEEEGQFYWELLAMQNFLSLPLL
jgi:hypothetical protein